LVGKERNPTILGREKEKPLICGKERENPHDLWKGENTASEKKLIFFHAFV
jgi:hypothetical protein